MSYNAAGQSATAKPFIITPYRPDSSGCMVPAIPTRCIRAVDGDPECQLCVAHLRDRKTGPRFPLAVLRCRVHGCAFTLYPPGHVPWGRRSLVHVDLHGETVRRSTEEWRGTPFEASADAARGTAWDRASECGSESWWSTQGRWIGFSLDLIGLAAAQGTDLRHRIADALNVATLDLLAKVRAIGENPGFRARGKAVVAVLEGIPVKGLLRRLLVAGHLAGCWGPPMWWDIQRRSLVRLVFPDSGTDPHPAADRSTISGHGPPPGCG